MKGKPGLRVYLIRHGETANAEEVCFNGHFDVDLSARGVEQIRRIAEGLKGFSIQAVYSSDLRRTRVSAGIVSEPHGLEPAAFAELRELSFGEWEGLSVEEVNRKYPGQLEQRLQNIETFQVEGGETFPQLRDRVVPKFNEIIARHHEGCIAILSHGGVNRVILGHLLGIPLKNIFRIHQDYAAINIIQFYENAPVVELVGGSHHHIPGSQVPGKKVSIQ